MKPDNHDDPTQPQSGRREFTPSRPIIAHKDRQEHQQSQHRSFEPQPPATQPSETPSGLPSTGNSLSMELPAAPAEQPVTSQPAQSEPPRHEQPNSTNNSDRQTPREQPVTSHMSAQGQHLGASSSIEQTAQPGITPPSDRPKPVMDGYSSNPFMATAKGLGKALTVNPISSLTIGFILIGAVVLFAVGGALLGAALPESIGVIITLLLFVGLIYLFAKGIAAATVVHIKSHEGGTVTGRQAFGSLSSRGIWTLIGALFLSGVAVLAGLLLFIVPGIVIGSRLALAPFAVYNEKLSVIDSLKRSWTLTRGHTWEMLGAGFAAMLINGSGGFLSVIGGQSSYANRYFELLEAEKTHQSTGKMHWLNPGVFILTIVGLILYIATIAALSAEQMKIGEPRSTNGSYCYYANPQDLNGRQICVNREACQDTQACLSTYPSLNVDPNMLDERTTPRLTN